jgi:hypothetical protein
VRAIALALLVLVASGAAAFAAEFDGRIVGVRDGDTVDLLTVADVDQCVARQARLRVTRNVNAHQVLRGLARLG